MFFQAVDSQSGLESTGRSRIAAFSPPSVNEQILRNSLWNALGKFVCVPLNLLLVPFVLACLGAERYGLWVALFALVDYAMLFDLGVGAATIKLAAEFKTDTQAGRLGSLAATALLFCLLFVPPLAAACGFAAEILAVLRLAPADPEEAVRVFRWVLALFALTQLQSVFRNLLIGLQQIHFTNLCEIVYFLLYALVTVLILRGGGGMGELVAGVFVLRAALGVAEVLLFLRATPRGLRSSWRPDRRIASRLLGYGGRLQLTSLAGLLNFQYDKLLIGYVLRTEFIAFYELGSKLAALVRFVPSALLAPLIPAASELSARNETESLAALYREATRYLVLLAAPVAAILAFHADALCALWLGGQADPRAALALRWLAVAYFFNIATGGANAIGRGTGRLRPEMEAAAAISLLNVCSSLAFILLWGYPGVIAGTALSMAAGNLLYLRRFGRLLGEPWGRLLARTLAGPVACAVAAGAASRLVFLALSPEALWAGRMELLPPLAASLLGFALLFFPGLWLSRSVAPQDFLRARQALASMRRW